MEEAKLQRLTNWRRWEIAGIDENDEIGEIDKFEEMGNCGD